MATQSVNAESIRGLVEKGKAQRPELASRLEKAGMIVLFRTVNLTDPAHHEYMVESEEKPGEFYRVNGVCQCQDFTRRAPGGWCKHRLATALIERAQSDADKTTVAAIVAEWMKLEAN
jgi:hypothetical protein